MCVSPNLPIYPSPSYPPFCSVNFFLNSKESKKTPTNCVTANTSILVCLLSKRLLIRADDVDGDNYWLDVHPCGCFPTVCLLAQRLLPAWCRSPLQLPGLWITVCSVARWLRGPADAPISHRCHRHIKGLPCLSMVALLLVHWASLSSPDSTNPLPQIPTSPTLLSWAASISGQEVPWVLLIRLGHHSARNSHKSSRLLCPSHLSFISGQCIIHILVLEHGRIFTLLFLKVD